MCTRLYAELAGMEYYRKMPPRQSGAGGFYQGQTETPNVCQPDCFASALEGLPGLVEKWTGHHVEIQIMLWPKSAWVTDLGEGEIILDDRWKVAEMFEEARHLPHSCLLAAFAACIILGRKA